MIDITNLAAAQRQYDRMSPSDELYEKKPDFNGTLDTELFIDEFAKSTDDASMVLENMGCVSNGICIAAEMLRAMCRVWVKGSEGKESVYSVAGAKFFETMRELAEEAYYC